jgi:hypothetical protein
MLEPLGESQGFAYLQQLARSYEIHLISFEKPQDWNDAKRMEAMRKRMVEADIALHAVNTA